MRTLAGWLGPWRPQGATANRLGVVLTASLAWNVLLVLDGNTVVGATAAGLVATVAAYPALALWIATALRNPGVSGIGTWLGRRVLSISRPLLLVTVAVALIQVPSLLSPRAHVIDDVTPSVICASRDVLQGRDPYQTPELLCLHRLHISAIAGTPLRAGQFANLSRYPTPAQMRAVARAASAQGYRTVSFAEFGYPPMSFVWMLPVASFGRDWWVIWTLLAALAFVVGMGLAARQWWPAVVTIALLQWGSGSALSAATQGDAEFFAFALMAAALFLVDRPRLSAGALGLAAASNPLAWFLVPAYLVFTARLPGWRQRVGWMVGVAAAAVLPWVLIYPGTISGVLSLILQPTFAFGIGLTALNVVQPLTPLLPKAFYFGALAAAEAGVLIISGWSRRLAAIAPAMAVPLLWLSWRSEANYLGQLPLLACAMVVGLERLGWTAWRSPAPHRTQEPELAAGSGL